jgi:CRISP-associated protein Cas1
MQVESGPLTRTALTLTRLEAAFQRVQSNSNAAGVDRVTPEQYGEGLTARLNQLRRSVVAQTYRSQALKRAWLPRPSKPPRPLAIPAVNDRVLQTAVAMVLTPLFEAEFESCSFAYRQARGVRQAVERVRTLYDAGYRWVVDADIEKFFDRIPHQKLIARCERLVTEACLQRLLAHWIATPVQGEPKKAMSVAQGSPISPMLANLYLDNLDEVLLAHGFALVRYADDFIVLAREKAQAEQAFELTEITLANLGLELNRAKTRLTHFDQGFHFLGVNFIRSHAFNRPNNSTEQALLMAMTPTSGPGSIEAALNEALEEKPDWKPSTETPAPAPALNPEPEPPQALTSGATLLQRTLYLLDDEAQLARESEKLVVRKDDKTILELPIIAVDQVLVFGRNDITTPAMQLCLLNGVSIGLLSRLGKYYGRIEAPSFSLIELQRAQWQASANPEFVLETAKAIVRGKLENSARILTRYGRHRNTNTSYQAAITTIRESARRVKTAENLETLRGLEGNAASEYFAALRVLIPAEWGFTRRQQRPAMDPINALLSFGYTILYQSVAGLLQARGLNAHLGLFHTGNNNHLALASDLMEEFRAVVVDAVILNLVLNGKLTLDDFTQGEERCEIHVNASRLFVRALEDKFNATMQHPSSAEPSDMRRIIDSQVVQLVALFRAGPASIYKPVKFD